MTTAMRTCASLEVYTVLALDAVPISVAIFGSWSSGKTTLMSALLAATPDRENRDVACGRVAVIDDGTVATTVRAGPGWAASPRYRDETVIFIDLPGATASMPPQFVVYRPPAGMTAPVDGTTYPVPAQRAVWGEDVDLAVVRWPRPQVSPLHICRITPAAGGVDAREPPAPLARAGDDDSRPQAAITRRSASPAMAFPAPGPRPPGGDLPTTPNALPSPATDTHVAASATGQQSAPFPARCVTRPGRRRDQVVLCARARPAHATARARPPGDAVRRRNNPPTTRRVTAVAAQRMAAYPRRPSEPAGALHSA